MSLLERLTSAKPAWSEDPAPEVLIRSRSGSVSSRRPYPAARNDRFIPAAPILGNDVEIENVGEGNVILIGPDDPGGGGGSVHRIKRIKSTEGAGAAVLVEQEEGDEENKLRTIQGKPGGGVVVEQQDDEIHIGTQGADGTANFNIDGNLTVEKGLVTAIFEGERGKTGALKILRCGSTTPETILEWENGQMKTEGDVVLEVGECNDGGSSGGSFF
jgi:hypothetical protein